MSRTGAPPSKITAHSTSIICQDTDLRGDITISEGCVVHPKATILALGGAIVIEKNCVIEEGTIIVNRNTGIMSMGDNNHFMVGCRVEAISVGNWNTFQPRSTVSSNIIITDHCTFSAGTTLLPSPTLQEGEVETIPPYTVIYGVNSERRKWDGTGQSTEQNLREKHIEYLREIVPK
ncbi:hypothetical protein L486_07405 [Kwoniella mangroviensis CBS 10435]|uniref:Dynactin subunit 6 n=1 Tax=Kwoniella mangroviensis CBS 10435 TaxID=1331196 RepID=A0A1B9IIC2_9TREE|nr:hypothetical protein L486_07405 [Kwoniella mangroviensis CBS 10435]OCF71981.1 hypothetical protein I204_07245 [Kwoniella mangroviensis CBS 8886]